MNDENNRGPTALTERMVQINNLLLSLRDTEGVMATAILSFKLWKCEDLLEHSSVPLLSP